jgi:hypothetical protein
MASLNVAVTMVFVHASLAPVGATESTVGELDLVPRRSCLDRYIR